MKWFEYIILIVAIGLVLLPFILKYSNKKKGKSSCGCECSSCGKDCPLKEKKEHIEKLENYEKGEQIMIYLNKDHDIENKYDRVDWVLTPLVVFFNNTLDLLGKKNIEHVRNSMNELPCSMQRAMDILKLTAYERKEIEKYFQA